MDTHTRGVMLALVVIYSGVRRNPRNHLHSVMKSFER